MNKHSDKYNRELSRRRRLKAKLLEDCATDSQGRKLCSMCEKLPDYRGLSLMHIKALSQGGRTSKKNCRLACFSCHNGPKGHRTENMPKSVPVDKPVGMRAMSGCHGPIGIPFTREMQAGHSAKRKYSHKGGRNAN